MTAILFYANYDNNYISIIRTHFLCQVTNLAYANTFVANLDQNLWFRDRYVNYVQIYHSDDGHFVHKCVNHKGNG